MSTILRAKRSPGNKSLGNMAFSGLLKIHSKDDATQGNFTCEVAFHITPLLLLCDSCLASIELLYCK